MPRSISVQNAARPWLLPCRFTVISPRFLLTLLLASTPSFASASLAHAGTESEHQVWVASILQVRPVKESGFLGWFDVHDRRRSDSTLLILRPALGYQFTGQLTVYGGYAWIPTFVDGGPARHEHRIWQQIIWNAPAEGGWALSLRPRLEQRFAEGGDDTGHRFRLFARAGVSAWPGAPVLFVVWDEIFYQFNDTDWGAVSGFDQNRVFGGLGFPAAPGLRFEVGYLNVFLDRTANHLDHNLAVNVFYTY